MILTASHMNFRIFLFALLIAGFSGLNAQTVVKSNDGVENGIIHHKTRLAPDQSLTVSPNPLPKNNAFLSITAVNVEIYSYTIVTASGQIVELENLSGRPDISLLDLNGAVDLGMHFIIFETDAGKITRKFLVI